MARCCCGRSGIASASSAREAWRRAMTRSTSSSVTMPSPLWVCSRTITWPLFALPARYVDTHVGGLLGEHVDRGTCRGPALGRDDAARTVGAIQDEPDRSPDRAGQRKAVLAMALQQFAGRSNPPQPRVHHTGQL